MGKWDIACFDDVLTIINGKNQRQVVNPNGLYPIYGSGGVMGYANNYLCEADTVVIGRKGTINNPIYVEEPFWNVDTAFGLRANDNELFPKYLFYFCKQYNFEALNTTVTIPSLTKANLLKIRIPLPPLRVQRQIADVLDRASTLIEKRKAQIDKLDLLVKSQFIEMFGDPVTNSMGWKKEKLGSLLSVEPQNGFYRPQSDYRTDGSGVPILRIDAFYNGKVTDWSTLKRLICTDSEKERYLLRKGDIVINRVNSIEYLGKCALIEGFSEDTVFESNMMRFHANEKLLLPVYLTYFLCLPYVYDQIVAHAKKSVNQASINQKDVQDFDILIPPLPLQAQFGDFVQQIEAKKQLLNISLDKLEQNYKSLMQSCFRGEMF